MFVSLFKLNNIQGYTITNFGAIIGLMEFKTIVKFMTLNTLFSILATFAGII